MKPAVIPGFTRYTAYESGAIWSDITNRFLRPGIGTNRRALVQLVPDDGGPAKTVYVHVAVCSAFHGPRPKGAEVSHLDGHLWNNAAGNLRWETREQNLARRREHGTDDRGFKNSRASVTPDDVASIKKMRIDGWTHQSIADAHGVSRTTVSRILNGRRFHD